MFSLEPPFAVMKCEPVTALFGGFSYSLEDLQKPYTPHDLASRMKSVVESVGKSLEGVYDIKAKVQADKSRLSTTICPIDVMLKDEGLLDVRLYTKTMKEDGFVSPLMKNVEVLCDKMRADKAKIAMQPRYDNNGFYLMQELDKRFDPKSTADAIEALERLMLGGTHNRFEPPKKQISDDCLKVDLNIGSDRSMEYIV